MENGGSFDNSEFEGSSLYLSPDDSLSDPYITASAGSEVLEVKDESPDVIELEQFDKNLPDTVTFLFSPEGAKVYIVGTSHFSIESQNDVGKVIQSVKPHAVVVELCRGRASIMEMDEEAILNESKSFTYEKVKGILKQTGVLQGLVYVLLLKLSSNLAKTYGIAPGGEFRRALKEIKKLKQCTLYYGDRPLLVTIKRALARLNFFQTVCLFFSLLLTRTDNISLEQIEKYKQKDILEELTQTLVASYPELSEVLITERDIFLTHALQTVCQKQYLESVRDNGVTPRIVAIVGIGHRKGITHYWGTVKDEDIIPLVKIPEASRSVRIASVVFKTGATILLLYGCYRLLPVKRLSVIKLPRFFSGIYSNIKFYKL